ncbi:acyl-CoA synthetase [Actinoallomurus rhizosphaericola]|uniref:acyl-CoA synthetase n=1 Tax=Actinoallomurus rhizosphaericola TaxID=2952536 RepID=UPI002093CCE4|nr:long-chain fatty acid--CoA ligase [Actinoallomurus rhizosphaericola]MCO5999487.1 long-chain fatty acid--CoA ligase [Actinoallomurus rhizosphaericola]
MNLGRWIRDRARTTPHRTAIVFGTEEITYAELDDRSERLAAGLAARGLRRGDRVATLTDNRPEHAELFFACAKAGLILVPMNVRLTVPELAYQIADAEPAMLFTAPGLAAPPFGGPVLDLTRAGLDAVAAGPSQDGLPGDGEPGPDAGLLIVYTSGTTGRPKGALLSHANCFWTNLSLDRGCELREDDVVLQVLPQFHVGGWNVQPLLAWWKGATVVLEPSFDAGRALRLIAERRVSTMMGVPATYQFMAAQPEFATADLSSLRCVVVGGAPMPEPLLRTWLDRGVRITQGYGLTEAAPNVLCLPPEEVAGRVGWAGKPYPHVDVALLGPDGPLDGPGRGELVVRGPNVFTGYWRNPAATREAVPDGWLRTGDVAERDAEGFYRICDRVKDMYVSGGENVYPAEVESVLAAFPGVAEVAVVGVPDERWGEVGCAFVAGDVPVDALLAHCREHLAAFKVPRHVRLVPALPRSAVGKTLKNALRSGFAG